jgi:hypothetical protein
MLAIRAPRMFDGEAFKAGAVTVLVDAGRIAGIGVTCAVLMAVNDGSDC